MERLHSIFFRNKETMYLPVADDSLASSPLTGETKEYHPDSGGQEPPFYEPYIKPRTDRRWHLLAAALFACNIFFMSGYLLKTPTEADCTNALSVWSPLNEVVEYEEFDFDNAFAHQTIYRGPPSVQLEKAWEDLWLYDGVRFPEDKLHLVNRSADLGHGRRLIPIDDEKGGYHSMFEVFHQLHCLNLVRQYTWKDWYFRHPDVVQTPGDLLAGDVGARMHVDHCIEALRISLMCHGDTTPYFPMIDPTAPQGHRADFSPHHKCRKFEPLRQWVEDNQLRDPKTGKPLHAGHHHR